MPRKEHKYHYIYKTTDLRNGNYYLGMHSTFNLEDGYLGSGKRLRNSIRKYGKENFSLEILEFLPNREALIEREKELITEEVIKDSRCMNLMKGGHGGFISKEHQIKCSLAGIKSPGRLEKAKSAWQKLFKNETYKLNHSIKTKLGHKKRGFDYKSFLGKNHKEESKKKIGLANSKYQKGEGNSQFGTMWITNGETNKKIKKDSSIPEGWYKGRIQ